jgi:hypothetical protein
MIAAPWAAVADAETPDARDRNATITFLDGPGFLALRGTERMRSITERGR